MSLKSIIRLAAYAFIGIASAACSNDEPEIIDDGSKVDLPSHRMFVLNQGTWGQNNASISFIDCYSTVADIDDIFLLQNGSHLGDTANDIIVHRGYMYVAVSTSNYLVRLNSAGVEECRVSFVSDPDLMGGIRFIAADGNSIYATFYGGYLLRLNASTLDIEAKVKTPASNLEGIAIVNGTIYAADAYEITPDPATGYNNYIYHNRLLTYSASDLRATGEIVVGTNPDKLIVHEGKIFVLCLGDYATTGNTAYMVDPAAGNTVSTIGAATELAGYNGKIYIVDSQTDWATYTTVNNYYVYDINSGRIENNNFLKQAPDEVYSSAVSMISVNPADGYIYVGITHYASSNGDLYRFDRTGTYEYEKSSGGQHPVAAVFFN